MGNQIGDQKIEMMLLVIIGQEMTLSYSNTNEYVNLEMVHLNKARKWIFVYIPSGKTWNGSTIIIRRSLP